MNSLSDTYTLQNGVKIPCVGFGTYSLNGGEGAELIKEAINIGYRHIDTAFGYGNEDSVGLAVKRSGVPREELFIVSKLPNEMHGYEKAWESFEATLKNLDTEYLDLYLIHWANPVAFRDCWEEANAGAWRAFEEILESGKAKSIGISNFLPRHIDALMKTAKITPMANQMRLCPGDDGFRQNDVSNYCAKRGIRMISYSPLGSGKIMDVPEMREIAQKYGREINQISLRWHIQKGFIPIPRTKNIERMKSNADIFGFSLSEPDIEFITNLTDCCGAAPDPDTSQW
ncbi:MAG: aldo/keto reductase [Oscillospiraceae bacterium]|jgi:diketogulonate reductase-like aldo/keto reductase|nr:aldo/keto reductase [Oscillospiraceae bacterium]